MFLWFFICTVRGKRGFFYFSTASSSYLATLCSERFINVFYSHSALSYTTQVMAFFNRFILWFADTLLKEDLLCI